MEKLAKVLFYGAVTILLIGSGVVYGAWAYSKDIAPVPQWRSASKLLSSFLPHNHPRYLHLQPARGQGEGVTVNKTGDDGALVMMAGFFDETNQIRLVRRDGSVVKSWSLNYFEHFPDPAARACDILSPLRIDTHGVVVTPGGEVVFNYEYCGTVKLDQCGDLQWRIARKTHHSIVTAEEGGYWILGQYRWRARELPDRIKPFAVAATKDFIYEDTVMRVSEDGEVLDEFSIPVVMLENGLAPFLTAGAENFEREDIRREEIVHSNKITELPSALADVYPLFETGDLALSLRGLNLVMVIDPKGDTVKWHQTGPWLRQHDPEFRPDGRLSIFNNNVFRTSYTVDGQTDLTEPRITNIMAIDPVSRETEVIFGERPGQEMLSVIRGQHQLLDNGGMLITEFDAGRVLEVDAAGNIVWSYVNHYSDDFVGEVIDAAVYPADYFEVEWEKCSQ